MQCVVCFFSFCWCIRECICIVHTRRSCDCCRMAVRYPRMGVSHVPGGCPRCRAPLVSAHTKKCDACGGLLCARCGFDGNAVYGTCMKCNAATCSLCSVFTLPELMRQAQHSRATARRCVCCSRDGAWDMPFLDAKKRGLGTVVYDEPSLDAKDRGVGTVVSPSTGTARVENNVTAPEVGTTTVHKHRRDSGHKVVRPAPIHEQPSEKLEPPVSD